MKKLVLLLLMLLTLTACSSNDEYDRDYMFDDDGEYVDIIQVNELLSEKYFGDYENEMYINFSYTTTHDIRISLIFQEEFDYDFNELAVKMYMYLEEMSNYTYYISGFENIEIDLELIDSNDRNDIDLDMEIPIKILNYSNFTVRAEDLKSYYNYIKFHYPRSKGYIDDSFNQLYDTYKTDGTFEGYVLNYK